MPLSRKPSLLSSQIGPEDLLIFRCAKKYINKRQQKVSFPTTPSKFAFTQLTVKPNICMFCTKCMFCTFRHPFNTSHMKESLIWPESEICKRTLMFSLLGSLSSCFYYMNVQVRWQRETFCHIFPFDQKVQNYQYEEQDLIISIHTVN